MIWLLTMIAAAMTVQFMSMLKITSEYLRSDLIKGDPHG